MVDTMEVTLDSSIDARDKLNKAIEKTTKAYEKEEATIIKSVVTLVNQMAAKQNKETLAALSQTLARSANVGMEYQPKAPGFLDKIIGSITGKGSMVGGLVAGGTAGGMLILADVIKDLTKQSKILGEVYSKVQESMGLLIDLILLPFLPLIASGLIFLYGAIVNFGKLWGDFVKDVEKEGLVMMLIKVGLVGIVYDWLENMFKWMFGTPQEKKQVEIDVMLALKSAADNPLIWSLPWITDLLLGQGTFANITRALSYSINVALGVLTGISDGFWKWLNDSASMTEEQRMKIAFDFFADILSGIGKFCFWIYEVIIGNKDLEISLGISLFLKEGADLWKFITGGANLPARVGGTSSTSGGAQYTGKTAQSIGGNTFIFNGLTDSGLESKVKEIDRQAGASYTL